MASRPELIAFETRESMAARVAELTGAALQGAVAARGSASFAVSGGSTPKPLYKALARSSLDWPSIDIGLVDERWVAPDHPRSNEAFVRNAFSAAPAAKIVGMYNGAATSCDGVAKTTAAYAAFKDAIDVAILGLGPDGHTASWFPHADGLDMALASDDMLCAVRAKQSDVTGDEVDRMTLTLSAVRSARLIILMITGDEKRSAFEEARAAGPVEDMPVRAIFAARPDLWVCWAP